MEAVIMGNLELAHLIEEAAIEIIKWLVIFGLTFLGAQIVGYIKLKKQVLKNGKDINGVRLIVDRLEKKVGEEYIEHILEESVLKERISFLEGKMGIQAKTNGHA